MPSLAGEHVPEPLAQLGDLRLGLPHDPLLDHPALGIDRSSSDAISAARRVAGEQQLEAGVGVAEPAGGVDSRREPEPERARVERARIRFRDGHQRAQTRSRGARKGQQPFADEPAVLAHQRHQVGDRRQRHKLNVVLDARRPERLGELVGDRGPAQLDARIPANGGMDDLAVGQPPVRPRRVMVGDDDVDSDFARGGDLVDRGDRAVDGDEQRRVATGEATHGVERQAVTVGQPVGQVPADVRPERSERPDHRRGGTHAVDVVVAVHDDPAAVADVALDHRDRAVDPGERTRIVSLGRIQERACGADLGKSTADEYLCQHVAHAEVAFERERGRQVIRRDLERRRRSGRIGNRAERDVPARRLYGCWAEDRCCLGHGGSV